VEYKQGRMGELGGQSSGRDESEKEGIWAIRIAGGIGVRGESERVSMT